MEAPDKKNKDADNPASWLFRVPLFQVPCLYVGRLEILIFRRAGAGLTAELMVKVAELLDQRFFAGCQVGIGKLGLSNRKARGQFLDMRRPSPDSGGRRVRREVGADVRFGRRRNDLNDATARLDSDRKRVVRGKRGELGARP